MIIRILAPYLIAVLPLGALVFGYGCPIRALPAYMVTIENRLDEPVIVRASVFEDGKWSEWWDRGIVGPKGSREAFGLGLHIPGRTWRIEARSTEGRTLATWELTQQQIADRGYTLVVEMASIPTQTP